LDGFVVVVSRGVIGEDNGFGKIGEFTHREAMLQIADKKRIVAGDVVFGKETVKGRGIVGRENAGEYFFVGL
jgi:hypothetical protein